MINPLRHTGLAQAIEASRTDRVKAGAPAAKVAASASGTQANATPAAALAAQGAPVDAARVAGLKSAIAAGTYRIDPKAIADAMIAQDLSGSDQ